MGIYDRDWWRESYNQRSKAEPKSEDTKQSYKEVAHKPKRLGDVPGVDWHWTVKLLAYGTVGTILLVVAKYLSPLMH